MKVSSRGDLLKKSDRELAGMKEEISKGLAACEQQRRSFHSLLADIRRVQAHRRNIPVR